MTLPLPRQTLKDVNHLLDELEKLRHSKHRIPQPVDHKGNPLRCQAQRVFERFGMSPYRLAELLEYNPTTCYHWMYRHPIGTGGIVPTKAMRKLIQVARREGVMLHASDFDPRPMP